MKNYVYIYHNEGDTAPSQEAMAAWAKWFGSLGDKVVDAGNPLTGDKVVLKDGHSTAEKDSIIGYSIVKAKSLDEAVDMAKGCPLASAPGTSVRVYETVQM